MAYPLRVKAGIQRIKNPPRTRNNIMVLSASRCVFYWIPDQARNDGLMDNHV